MGLLSPNVNGLFLISLALLLVPATAAALTSPAFPLTTVFTPPPNCFTDVSLFSGYGYPTAYSVGLGPGNEFSDCSPCWLGLATASSCYPPSYSISATYSPGVCPEGYEIACSSLDSNGKVFETVATCCPSGYACAPSSRVSLYPWYASQPCSYYPDTDLSITALSVNPTTTITTEFPPTMAPGFAILANSVQIRWQSTDTGVIPTTTTSPPATVTYTQSVTVQPTSENTSSTTGTGPLLSGGAKAGIAVVATVVGLVILLRLCVCFRRRPQPQGRATTQKAPGEEKTQGQFSKPELETTTQPARRNADTRKGIFELDTVDIPNVK